jgi:hypothetical protein
MAINYLSGDTRPFFPPIASSNQCAVNDVVGVANGTLFRASDQAWGTAIATPTAPTVTNGAVAIGSPLTAAATKVCISYQFPWGEGTVSSTTTATPTAGAGLVVSGSSLVPPSPALYTNVYVETSAGSGVFQLYGQTYGSPVLVTAYGAGQVPYAQNSGGTAAATGALQVTQYNFALNFAGIATQAKPLYTWFGAAATVPYGNSLPVVRVCPHGLFIGDLATPTTVSIGQYLAPAKDTGNNLLNQSLTVVTSKALAIASVVQAGTNLSRVQFVPVDVIVPGS